MIQIFLYNLDIALEAIRQNKMRSFLTSLGIIFGVASVIAMLAIGRGAQEEVLSQMKLLGTNNVIVKPVIKQLEANVSEQDVIAQEQRRYSPGLTLADMNSIKEYIPFVDFVSPEIIYETSFIRSGRIRTGKLVGVNQYYFDINNFEFEQGRPFTEMQMIDAEPVCVIGSDVANKFFAGLDPLGEKIKAGNVWLTVVGVLAERQLSTENIENLGIRNYNLDIFVPVTSSLLRYRNRALVTGQEIQQAAAAAAQNDDNENGDGSVSGETAAANYHQIDKLIVQVSDTKYSVPIADIIRKMLKRRHNSVVDFEVIVPELLLKQERRTQEIFNIVLSSIASISLIVGGIGIMNIMLASVVERYREIGVRRAVGAQKRDIHLQFLTEALAISISGGLVGIFVGIAFSYLIEITAGIFTIVTLASILISFGVAMAIGVIFGFFPQNAQQNKIQYTLYAMNKPVFTAKFCILPLLIGIVSAATETAFAQPQDTIGTLTLEECIEIAREQSPVAQANRYALTASRWEYQSYRADLLPSLSISGDAPNFNKSIFSNVLDDGTITFSSRTQSEASTALSVNQNILATGGILSLSSGITRLGIFQGENTYQWQSTPMVVGLRQPIFQFNNLKWRTRLEPLQYQIAQKEFVEDMEQLSVTVTQRFFDVLLAKINLENARFNVARNDSIFQISQGRYNVGSIAENDLLQSELALRNAEAQLTRARLEYDRSLNEFKIILGYTTDVRLDVTAPEQLPEIELSVEKARELAIQNNSEAMTYRYNELQADRDFAQAKSQSGFSATLNANYGLNQTAEEFADLYRDTQNRQFITVGFEVPIFNWGKQQAQINAARNQQREVANSIEFQRRQFYQQVDYTVSQFLQLKDQVLLAAQSDTIAQRRYNVAQNRYLIGRIDVTNLFIAQNEKDAARQEYIRALRDFWSGWYELRELTLYDFQNDRPITYDY